MIFLLHGTDTFRIAAKLSLLRQKFLVANPDGVEIRKDGGDLTPKGLTDLISPSLFLGKRFIVIKNLLESHPIEEHKKFIEICDQPLEDVVLVFCEEGLLDSKSPLGKWLNAPGRAEQFKTLTPTESSNWTMELAKSQGLALSREVAAQIASYCGYDSWRINSELAKLKGLSDPVSTQTVDQLVHKTLSAKAFDLLDAISAGNTALAHKIVSTLFASGEDPLRLLGMLNYHFRALAQVADGNRQGWTKARIATTTKLHPFVVQKNQAQASRRSQAWINQGYRLLADSDWLIKTGQKQAPEELVRCVVSLSRG